MARSRQILIIKTVDPSDDEADGLPPLGTCAEVQTVMSRYNTAADGGPKKDSAIAVTILHGPGMYVEVYADDAKAPVKQMMVTMTDQDFAFPVLTRVAREQRWTLLDPDTGQRLRFS